MLILGNKGRRPCNLSGYAAVRLSDQVGPMPFSYQRGGALFFDPNLATVVTLRPGSASAFIVIAKSTCETGDRRVSTLAEVTIPSATSPAVMPLPLNTGLSTCNDPAEDSAPRIFIGPVQYLWPGMY